MKKEKLMVFLMVFALVSMITIPMLSKASLDYTKSIDDPTGDVIGDQNDAIDITEVKTEKNGDKLDVTLTVAGKIDYPNTTLSIILDSDGTEYKIESSGGYSMITGGYTETLSPTVTEHSLVFSVSFSEIEASSSFSLDSGNAYDSDGNFDMASGSNGGDDGSSTPPEEYDNDKDPATETPTDTSIGVSIGDISLNDMSTETVYEYEVTMDGTTSGSVNHCAVTIVTYYTDGTHDDVYWYVGPKDQDYSYGQQTFELSFKGAGSGGKDDWSSWEYRMYSKFPKENETDDGENGEDGENDKEIDKSMIFVRAFSDADRENWNQDSKKLDLPTESDGTDDSDDDDGDGTPGFGFAILISTIFIAAAIYRQKTIGG